MEECLRRFRCQISAAMFKQRLVMRNLIVVSGFDKVTAAVNKTMNPRLSKEVTL